MNIFINFVLVSAGAFIGMLVTSACAVNAQDEAYQRGRKVGHHEGYIKGHADGVRTERKRHDEEDAA